MISFSIKGEGTPTYPLTHNGIQYQVDPVPISRQSGKFLELYSSSPNRGISISDPFSEQPFQAFIDICEGKCIDIEQNLLLDLYSLSIIWEAKALSEKTLQIIRNTSKPEQIVAQVLFLQKNNLPQDALVDLMYEDPRKFLLSESIINLPIDLLSKLTSKSDFSAIERVNLFSKALQAAGPNAVLLLRGIDFRAAGEETKEIIDKAFEDRHRPSVTLSPHKKAPAFVKEIASLQKHLDEAKSSELNECRKNNVHTFTAQGLCKYCGKQACKAQKRAVHSFNSEGICSLCKHSKCEQLTVHNFDPSGFCTICHVQFCQSSGDVHSFDGSNKCIHCGRERCSGSSVHEFGANGQCAICKREECKSGDLHEFGVEGICKKCGLQKCKDDRVHSFDCDGVCRLCHHQKCGSSRKIHSFGAEGLCTGCGMTLCKDGNVHVFGPNGICKFCRKEMCEASKDEHKFDSDGRCISCKKGRCKGFCVHKEDSTGVCIICHQKRSS